MSEKKSFKKTAHPISKIFSKVVNHFKNNSKLMLKCLMLFQISPFLYVHSDAPFSSNYYCSSQLGVFIFLCDKARTFYLCNSLLISKSANYSVRACEIKAVAYTIAIS